MMWNRNSPSVAATVFAAMLAATGCTESATDPDDSKDGGGDSGDSTGDMEAPSSGGMSEEPDVQLDDGVAGKGCEKAADCAGKGAMCLDEFEVAGSLGALLLESLAAPGGYCSGACGADEECGEGAACVAALGFGDVLNVEGQCEKRCSKDADCRDGYECVSLGQVVDDAQQELDELDLEELDLDAGALEGLPEGGFELPEIPTTCRPKPATAALEDGVVGGACEGNDDCAGDSAECRTDLGIAGLVALEAPGGYCTGACKTSDDCGADGLCVGAVANITTGTCMLSCESDDDCTREGYRCRQAIAAGGRRNCAPGAPALDDDEAGAACASSDDCSVGRCRTDFAGTDIPSESAFCSQECTTDSDCGAGGACFIRFQGLTPVSLCAEACDLSAPSCSREGFTCTEQADPSTQTPYCRPPIGAAVTPDPDPDPEPADCDPACGADAICNEGTCECNEGFEGDPVAGCTAVAEEEEEAEATEETE